MANAANNLFNPTALANGTSNLLVRDSAINQSTDLVQAGVVYNDAVRFSQGLWSKTGSGNQNPTLGSYTTDLHAVQNDIAAMLANPGAVTLGGEAFAFNTTDTAVLTHIQSQLGTLITAAGQTTNAATLTPAEQTLHAVQNEILQEINNDAHISAALNNVQFMSNAGANDVAFQNVPAGADDPGALAVATGGTSLQAVGEVFNAAAVAATGGINSSNLGEITNDFTAVQHGLTNILGNATMLAQIETGETANAAALTTIHLQTVLNQINLQLNNYDGGSTTGNQHALRGTSDNLLDIIDIIQNDANLNAAAGGTGTPGHVGGFAEMPGGLTGTITRFQDNQPQTNFWAAFAAEGNTINAHLTAIAGGQEQATAALVTQIQNYENFGASFDAAQGDIFRGRFDNELNSGTLQADTAAAVHGLTGILNGDTGAALAADNAQIVAAGQGFTADAADVGGNNIPIGGGTYVKTATTVATATSVNNDAQGTIPVTANPDIANGTGGTATAGTATATGGGTTPNGTGGAATSSTTTSGTGGGTTPNGTGGAATSSTTTSGTGGGTTPNGTGGAATSSTTTSGTPTSGGGAATTGAGDGHGTGTIGGGSGTGTGTGGSTGTGATGTGASGGGTDHNAGHGGDALANDIASLLQALQSGNSSGVSSAVKALGDDVHNGAATDVGGVTSAMSHMHLETFWHH